MALDEDDGSGGGEADWAIAVRRAEVIRRLLPPDLSGTGAANVQTCDGATFLWPALDGDGRAFRSACNRA